MNLKQIALILLLAAATTLAFGASIPRSVSGNIVTCQANAGCFNQLINGRIYKVLKTPTMTVKLTLWNEGNVTRADVIIANSSGLELSVLANDFRVDVLSPKPRTLSYLPSSAVPHLAARAIAVPVPGVVQIENPTELSTNSVLPDRNLHGRVSFERDPRAQQMNVVLPISGAVFEFPYVLQP